jgi:hypothetical protein
MQLIYFNLQQTLIYDIYTVIFDIFWDNQSHFISFINYRTTNL